MVCAVDVIIKSEGLDENQINEEIRAKYLGLDGKRVGAPRIASYINTRILENIVYRNAGKKGKEMPLVKISDLYATVTKIFASKEVSEEDYALMKSVFEQYDIDMYDLKNRFVSRVTTWKHIKNCLALPKKTLSEEEFLKNANTRIKYLRLNFSKLIRQASLREIGGKGTRFETALFVICKNCERSYTAEQFLREDFKCECAKEEV